MYNIKILGHEFILNSSVVTLHSAVDFRATGIATSTAEIK